MRRQTILLAPVLVLTVVGVVLWRFRPYGSKQSRFEQSLVEMLDLSRTEYSARELRALVRARPLLAGMSEHDSLRNEFWSIARQTEPKKIPWQEAKDLILSGKAHSVMQQHNLRVDLGGVSGQRYVTTEPEIDEAFRLVESVDPKRVFIVYGTE